MISGSRPPSSQEECWMDTAKKKRTALVTGGSRGLGRAMALELEAGGAHVAVNYFNRRDAAEHTCATILQSGGERRGISRWFFVRRESGGACRRGKAASSTGRSAA